MVTGFPLSLLSAQQLVAVALAGFRSLGWPQRYLQGVAPGTEGVVAGRLPTAEAFQYSQLEVHSCLSRAGR